MDAEVEQVEWATGGRREKQKHIKTILNVEEWLLNYFVYVDFVTWNIFFASRLSAVRVCRWTFFNLDSNAGWVGDTLMSRNFVFGVFLQRDSSKTKNTTVEVNLELTYFFAMLCGVMFGVPRSIVAEQWKSINKTDKKNEKSMWHTEDSINYRFDTFWFQISFLFLARSPKKFILKHFSFFPLLWLSPQSNARARYGSQSKRADGRWVIARCRRTVRFWELIDLVRQTREFIDIFISTQRDALNYARKFALKTAAKHSDMSRLLWVGISITLQPLSHPRHLNIVPHII